MGSFFSNLFFKFNRYQVINDRPPSNRNIETFFISDSYKYNLNPQYCHDFTPGTKHKIYQPDVYHLALCLASMGAKRIIDVGCGTAEKLKSFAASFQVTGIDVGSNIEFCQQNYNYGRWISFDLNSDLELPFLPSELDKSVIICADVIEHLKNPMPLLRNLKKCVDYGACVLLSTPEREIIYGRWHKGPPWNPSHVREWTIGELRALLRHFDFNISFLGLTAENNVDRSMRVIIAVLNA
jgi:2-polyprenyl-3-methyl-5-hydroxy-6-metoxy-1,4-benzoquinol methylase